MYELYISVVWMRDEDITGEFATTIKASSLEEAIEASHKAIHQSLKTAKDAWRLNGFELKVANRLVYSYTEEK